MTAATPLFVLSQDYELFFHESGSVQKCLFDPCEALLEFARKPDSGITFFVDAGMLLCMQRHLDADRAMRGTLDDVKRHIETLARAGHEIALHVHPHWEDTRWTDDGWDFSGTRYQFRDFSDEEIERIFRDYASLLAELSGHAPTSYRAGGFCVEPFARIGPVLADIGITVDSSVLPGALLRDPDKGIRFPARAEAGVVDVSAIRPPSRMRTADSSRYPFRYSGCRSFTTGGGCWIASAQPNCRGSSATGRRNALANGRLYGDSSVRAGSPNSRSTTPNPEIFCNRKVSLRTGACGRSWGTRSCCHGARWKIWIDSCRAGHWTRFDTMAVVAGRLRELDSRG